jgi:hypothetical protein
MSTDIFDFIPKEIRDKIHRYLSELTKISKKKMSILLKEYKEILETDY